MRKSRIPYSGGSAKVDSQPLPNALLDGRISREWAWEGATGKGIKVGILDSGVDNGHPAIDGRVVDWAAFSTSEKGRLIEDFGFHSDNFGHGTACADIIHRLAPDANLVSIKVLDGESNGSGNAVVAGLRWCIDHGIRVVNISLGVMRKNFAMLLYELADKAYFNNVILVTAANNMPIPSYPSLYASVISVACHDSQGPREFYYNPTPPVEFRAPGVNINVAWANKRALTVTGNSFAAPYITGLVAQIVSKHPDLVPFQVKTILRATASNVVLD